jgi:DNA-binding NtrC family response regulator
MSSSEEHQFYSGLSGYKMVVVCANTQKLNQYKYITKTIGFPHVEGYSSHSYALSQITPNTVSHLLFDARSNDMDVVAFVEHMFSTQRNITQVAITEDPVIDRVFDLICRGARGFLVPPVNLSTCESILISATKGPPFSEELLEAKDRNKAFAEIILKNLYRLTVALKQARQSEAAEEYVLKFSQALDESVELARMFHEHSLAHLQAKIVEGCLWRADEERTRLTKVRDNLKKARAESAHS